MARLVFEGMPLSVNQTYKRGRGKTIFLSEKARDYSVMIRRQAKMQWNQKPLIRNLEVSFYYYFGDARIHDHLNYNKCLSDSLNQIVWQDDKQITISHHYTFIDRENPRVELEIKEINLVA